MKIKFVAVLLTFLTQFAFLVRDVSAQESESVLYVPLIGITSVPTPLNLPSGGGNVIYNYAVKNFLPEVPLSNVNVVDDKCGSVKFVTGDDNNNSKLDYSETWRFNCTTTISSTTKNTATATGIANNTTATHKAYSTVVVGSKNLPPLVSIINTTKVEYPLVLPEGGSDITYTYKVNNPGLVSLNDVAVTDDKCSAMSGKLGDTNGNQLLDINEVWIYSCTMPIRQTTTDTVTVTAYANGLKAEGMATLSVKVDNPNAKSPPLFDVSISPLMLVTNNPKIVVWAILSGILAVLVIVYFLTRRKR